MEQKSRKKTLAFTRADRIVLESYKTLCEGLANYLGDGYEIVLHSLENYDNSVIKIINGYYTGRKEGAPITDLALHMLEDIRRNNGRDYIAYYSKNKKGEPMHSTTIAIRSENAKIVGLLCINFYLNTPLSSVMATLMKTDEGASVGREENFADSPSQLVGDTIAETKRIVMADADIPVHDKNKEIIARLYSKGFFKLKTVCRSAPKRSVSAKTRSICISEAAATPEKRKEKAHTLCLCMECGLLHMGKFRAPRTGERRSGAASGGREEPPRRAPA